MRAAESDMSAAEQARVFLAMAGCGAGLAAAYDVTALLRRALKMGRVLTGVMDLLYGVLCAFFMTLTALIMRVDPFRLYAFAGVAAGMALYAASMGTIVRKMCRFVRKFVTKS